MKILHTSDWHIGKQLHKIDLSQDLELFFSWLLKTIQEEKIDLLLVSGDIFDQANPSQASLTQYYNFLKKMIGTGCKIVITGGNHDSAALLNAPKDILSFLDIQVVGGAPENINELFFEYAFEKENIVIAAVPFLKDKDIRKSVEGEDYSDKIEQIKEGIKNYFFEVNEHYKNNFQGNKFIVMGHLYVQGAHISESMRDIQIGNEAGVDGNIFGSEPDYVALGHIHKPYAVSKSKNIHYSGSPISLSFSEKEDVKQVNIIDFSENQMDVVIVEIPKFRSLITFKGTLTEVSEMINKYNVTTELQTLGEIIVVEEDENITIRQALEDLILDHPNPNIQIVKSRLTFLNKVTGASEVFKTGTDVSDVTPMQMFEKRIELVSDIENTQELKIAFQEILEKLNL